MSQRLVRLVYINIPKPVTCTLGSGPGGRMRMAPKWFHPDVRKWTFNERRKKPIVTLLTLQEMKMINARHHVTVAEPLTASATWMPEGPGKWSRPLRFLEDDRGWVELMRLDPGVRLGLHRHTGDVHAYNLQGHRRLCTGEVVGPGDYVHELAGNVDWWEAIGDEPLVVFVVVMGTVEYLDARGMVLHRITTAGRKAEFERWKSQAKTVRAADRQEVAS